MEVLLNRCEGDFPEGSMLSVRAGNVVKRQSPMEPGKPMKFPMEAIRGVDGDLISEVTVEALAVLGKGKLYLNPSTDRYVLKLESTCENRKLNFDVEVRWSKDRVDKALMPKPVTTRPHAQPGSRAVPSSDKRAASTGRGAHRHHHAISAQKYLDQHKLLEAMHLALEAAVRERPEDPMAHMAQKLRQMSEESKLTGQAQVPATTLRKSASKGKVDANAETLGRKQAVEASVQDSLRIGGPLPGAIESTPPRKLGAAEKMEPQPAPEPSPAEGRGAARTGPDGSRFALPPLDPRSNSIGSSGGVPPPMRLNSASEVASVGDIEGEYDNRAIAQAAEMLLDEGWYEATKAEQRAQAADTRSRTPLTEASAAKQSGTPQPRLSAAELEARVRRAKAAELRTTSSDLAASKASPEPLWDLTPLPEPLARSTSRPVSPEESARRALHASAAEFRATPPSSPAGGPSKPNLRDSLDKASASTCSCGNKFLPDSAFCRKCGEQRPSADTCSCGSTFLPDSVFCRRCGTKRPTGAQASVSTAATGAQQKGAAAPSTGLRSGEVSKLVDVMEGQADASGKADASQVIEQPKPTQNAAIPARLRPPASSAGGTTVDQGLFDEEDFGPAFVIEELTTQAVEQLVRQEHLHDMDQVALEGIRQRLLSEFATKVKGNQLEGFVEGIFAAGGP